MDLSWIFLRLAYFGWLCLVLGGCGSFWMALSYIWVVVFYFWWKRLILGCCGWLRLILGGPG